MIWLVSRNPSVHPPGRDAKGRKEGEQGGRVPLGYRRIFREGKAIRVDVDTAGAVIVKRIVARRRKGATLTDIAHELNLDNIRTPQRVFIHT